MSEWEDYKTIWLQPWCNDCDWKSDEDRLWCQDDVWGECEQCGAKPAKYTLTSAIREGEL